MMSTTQSQQPTATDGLDISVALSEQQHESGIGSHNNSEMSIESDRENHATTVESLADTLQKDVKVSADNVLRRHEIAKLPGEVKVIEELILGAAPSSDESPSSPPLQRMAHASGGIAGGCVEAGKRPSCTPSKEEKQRHNEEIIILKSSSVSSETGSWESVPAEHLQLLQSHHNQLAGGDGHLAELNESKSTRTACFIDASSLLDESELMAAVQIPEHSAPVPVEHEIKDQFSSGDFTPLQLSGGAEGAGSSGGMLSSGESGYGATPGRKSVSPPTAVPLHPKESEKLKGSLVFKNSINQYSGVLIEDPAQGSGGDGNLPAVDRNFPLQSSRSDFTSLMDIYHENKRQGGGSGIKINYLRTQSENHAEHQNILLPDTPHNSILNLVAGSQPPDGRLHSGEEKSADDESTPKRQLKYLESTPIVSGGASVVDFSPIVSASPPVRRKLDTCPILSGGSTIPECLVEEPAKVTLSTRDPTSSLQSWVIDLNALQGEVEEAGKKHSDVSLKDATKQNFSQFYVSLDNGLKAVDKKEKPDKGDWVPRSMNTKKAEGFFVDFGNSDKEKETNSEESQCAVKDAEGGKNMFSMFVDFGERKPVPKKESLSFTSRFSETINRRRELERRSESPRGTARGNSVGEVEKCTSLPFVPLTTEEKSLQHVEKDVQLRPKFTSSVSEDRSRARSSEIKNEVESKRPISLNSYDKGLMSIIDKIPLLSKTSSMSIDSSISPLDDFTCSKSEVSTFSASATSNSSSKELSCQPQVLDGGEKERERKRKSEAKIGETFDKSSQGSITDGVISKDLSPDSSATATDELTYQNEPDPMAEGPLCTIVEADEKAVSATRKLTTQQATYAMETLQATIEKQRQLLEIVNENAETTSFVRLSDMDKPYQSFESYPCGVGQMDVSGSTRGGRDERRMKSSVAGNYYDKWRHNKMYFSTDTNMIPLASSVENSRSLSRIFPHLSKVFSNSLPTNVGVESHLSGFTSTWGSDISGSSSITSSCNPSVQESGDDASIFCRQPKRLGEDLLKMFLHEIGTDVTIDIGGRRNLKAHKCILQSRCQYFAAILAGGNVSIADSQISLPGFSYEAVHFALCHIYSGASHPPEGISLMELAAIADLLGLVGLREVTEYALKVNYCHNFHKPCIGCIEGTLQVLPVALNHGLDDLYRKCLKWTCKYYLKIWPTRAFASLSSDLRHRCQQQIIAHLSPENVLGRILECENLLAVVAPLRWGATVENILHEISDTAQMYLSEHFSSLIASDSFLSLGHDQCCNIPALKNLLIRSASTLSPDQACRSYQRVTKLNQVLHSKILTHQQQKIRTVGDVEEDLDWDAEFIRLVAGILNAVEQCLQRQCSRAMRTNSWQRLDLDLRKKIQKLACLTDPLFERRQRANARQQQQQKTPAYQVNYNRNQDIQQVRLAIHAHSKRSAQGYIVDQFTSNEARGRNLKSFSTTTQTQPQQVAREKRDKGVQASHDISSATKGSKAGGGKLEKSKSHNHVNGHSEAMTSHREKASGGVQRNASTSQLGGKFKTTSAVPPVKSRYMELPTKQSHRVVQPANDALRLVKNSDQFSSCSSTRTTSPKAAPRAPLAAAARHVDSNMSIDSLASPKKQITTTNKNNARISVNQDKSLSRDSLANSARTDETISQESLNVPVSAAKRNSILKNRQQKCTSGGSTSGSTSSVGGGRLMRNFSDSGVVFQNSSSKGMSTNSTSSNGSARTSFLSKKSREILARREMAEHQQGSATKVVATQKELENVRRSLPINKSSSTSNIPTRRRIFNTTLHLRKSAQVPIPEKALHSSNTSSSAAAAVATRKDPQAGEKPSRIAQKISQVRGRGPLTEGQRKSEKSQRDVMSTEKAFDLLCHEGGHDEGFESKMVRSSTFSKDCPDLIQSIEIE